MVCSPKWRRSSVAASCFLVGESIQLEFRVSFIATCFFCTAPTDAGLNFLAFSPPVILVVRQPYGNNNIHHHLPSDWWVKVVGCCEIRFQSSFCRGYDRCLFSFPTSNLWWYIYSILRGIFDELNCHHQTL